MGKSLVFVLIRRAIHIHLLNTSDSEFVPLQSNRVGIGAKFFGISHNFVGECCREEEYLGEGLIRGGEHPSYVSVLVVELKWVQTS
jgi:hypothetical protein